ncbi:MAG TPA: hypothetical protein VFN02_16345 [Ktedonobacteraceae bacterium]|nr:hypothetical protein [Ktedonobacteraceae bacterium]
MEPVLTRTSLREQPFCDMAVGNYHLLRQLGSGGSAYVYLAEHIYLKSLMALKLLTRQPITRRCSAFSSKRASSLT